MGRSRVLEQPTERCGATREAAEQLGLLECPAPSRYRLTESGLAVVRVPPDREAVGAVRGLGRAARAPRAVARGSWERFG